MKRLVLKVQKLMPNYVGKQNVKWTETGKLYVKMVNPNGTMSKTDIVLRNYAATNGRLIQMKSGSFYLRCERYCKCQIINLL